LRGELKEILATQRPPLLVLNLEGVEFLDSSGISMLVAMHNVMASKQGTLRLCGLSPHITRLLKIVNLSSFFAIYPMEREALCETAS
jgi:anti-anti-sigma factor